MSEPVQPVKKFSAMGAGEKLVFIGKVCVFLLTFGFAFPTVLSN